LEALKSKARRERAGSFESTLKKAKYSSESTQVNRFPFQSRYCANMDWETGKK